jgi:putative Mn2+ efflux pump MntP
MYGKPRYKVYFGMAVIFAITALVAVAFGWYRGDILPGLVHLVAPTILVLLGIRENRMCPRGRQEDTWPRKR